MTHICTHASPSASAPYTEFSEQGFLVTYALKNASQVYYGRRGGGKRGKVVEFSKSARWRLMKSLAVVNWGRSRMITLTFPSWVSRETLRDSQGKLRAFIERWSRHYGSRPCFCWRKEYTKAGIVHFHLLEPRAVWHDDLIHFVSRSWAEILATDRTDEVEKVATKVEFIRSSKHAMHYVSKYVAKVSDPFPEYHVGRVWGWVNRKEIPYAKKRVYVIQVSAFFAEKEKLEKKLSHHVFARKIDILKKWW